MPGLHDCLSGGRELRRTFRTGESGGRAGEGIKFAEKKPHPKFYSALALHGFIAAEDARPFDAPLPATRFAMAGAQQRRDETIPKAPAGTRNHDTACPAEIFIQAHTGSDSGANAEKISSGGPDRLRTGLDFQRCEPGHRRSPRPERLRSLYAAPPGLLRFAARPQWRMGARQDFGAAQSGTVPARGIRRD